MLIRIMTALALSATLGLATAPAAMACGDDHKEAAKPAPADAKTVTLKIEGMTCDGCANAVRNALLKLDGVFDATVSFETGLANISIDGNKVDDAKLGEVITKAGFKVARS